jgi:glutathione S-transferase
MSTTDEITLFHAPNSRSTSVLTLLEELGAPYRLEVLNLKSGQNRQPAYLAVNPLGKVPAVLHRGVLITEQVAVLLYLADLFPEKGLTPAIGDPRRAAYLRWSVYYASCYEPALVDKAMERAPGPVAMSPYGDFDMMIGAVSGQLEKAPYLLGEEMSAADILWGNALNWGRMFKLVPELPVFVDYKNRVMDRPSFRKADAIDTRLVAEQAVA